MKLTDWFRGLFKDGKTVDLNCILGELTASTFYKELALQASINLISNSIARSTFRTYTEGKEEKKTNHYILNVEANQNLSSSSFWREVVTKIIYNGECLVLIQNNKLYIADSFERKEYAFIDNSYKNIKIGDYEIKESKKESEVLYFKWYNEKLQTTISGLNDNYGKLIEVSSKSFKTSKGKKGTLEIPAGYAQTEDAQADLQDLLDNRFKKYFEAEGDALIPLTDGLKYNERGGNEGASKNTEAGREIRDFINDIFDFIAIGLRISPNLLKGNVADTGNAVNEFLSFCLNPFVKFITDELNRKMYGEKEYSKNTYVKCDTSNIKIIDLKDIANALDVLLRTGAYTINDCLKSLGIEPIDKNIGDIRFITKNYMPIQDMLDGNYDVKDKGEGSNVGNDGNQ